MVTEADIAGGVEATAAYCRRARRIRARLGHDPARMHRALREAHGGQRVEGGTRPVRRVRRASTIPASLTFQANPVVVEAFAADVERAMEGAVLRYSRRTELLRSARRLGIGRFEANLIIATVLHRRGDVAAVAEPASAGRGWEETVFVFLVIQVVIAGAVWWVMQ